MSGRGPIERVRTKALPLLETGVGLVLLAMTACVAPGSAPARLSPPAAPGSLLPAGCRGIEAAKQFQRGFWTYRVRADAQGRIPIEARQRAVAQARSLRAQLLALPGPEERWEAIGPAPIQGIPPGQGSNAAGRVTAIAVDPAAPEHWLVGTAQGGVWERRKGAWEARGDERASLAIGAIAFAPGAATRVYAGTGEVAFSPDAYGGAGLLRSDNGGQDWTEVRSTLEGASPTSFPFEMVGFSRIVVDPADSSVLVVATARSRLTQSGGFTDPTVPTGVLVSTSGGERFTLTLPGTATDLVVRPRDFQSQYAAIGDPCGDASKTGQNGVYRSTDGGRGWRRMSGPWGGAGAVGRIRLAIAPSDPNVLYVSVQRPFGKGETGEGRLLGLWRTDDAWAAGEPRWAPVDVGASGGYCGKPHPICWYAHVIMVDPRDARVVYAGGYGLWRRNADGTWTELSSADGGIHLDQQALGWAGARLLVGNDGGVWSKADGQGWAHHNDGLAITQFYRGALHPAKASFMIGGTQDNGTAIRRADGQPWSFLFGGDGVAAIFSRSRPDEDWVVTTRAPAGLGIHRVRNGGQKPSDFERNMGPDLPAPPYPGVLPFILPLTRCPDGDAIVHGAGSLWKTTNFFSASGRPDWVDNSPPIPGDEPRYASALAFAPGTSCATYALGTFNGRLWLTTSGGGTDPTSWLDLTPARAPFGGVVTGLAFHPRDRRVLYATLSGFGIPHVLRTDDALACAARAPGCAPRWEDLTPTGVDGRPVDTPFNAVRLHPERPDLVLAASDHGVWMSAAAGRPGSWQLLGSGRGLPNVAVYDLQIHPATHEVVAFTHGRGAFVLRLARSRAQPAH